MRIKIFRDIKTLGLINTIRDIISEGGIRKPKFEIKRKEVK